MLLQLDISGVSSSNGNEELPEDRQFTIECDHQRYSIRTKSDVAEFSSNCPNPKSLYLVHPNDFPSLGMTPKQFYSFLDAPILHACIHVQFSTIKSLNFKKLQNHTGSCPGPPMKITQNKDLRTISFHENFMRNARASSVVIRGNRNLKADVITTMKKNFPWYAIDLQDPGECGVPYPFKSFYDMKGCESAYGVLYVSGSSVRRASNVKLSLKGCISIEKSDLVDVDFLDDITNFTLAEDECGHAISKNSKLCIKDPQRLKMKFESLQIDQTANPDCETTCSGGVVNDQYLATLEGCQVINGSLVIQDWNRPPANLINLKNVQRIYGSLRVANTSGLKNFDYFHDLREIIVPSGNNGSAIEIVSNPGLSKLTLPRLRALKSESDLKIIISDNPDLTMKQASVNKLYQLAQGKKHTRIQYKDSTTFFDALTSRKWYLLISIMVVLILILVIINASILTKRHIQKRKYFDKYGFPRPPWHLQKRSQDILASWVKEIVLKNPLIWRCSDREIIWPYQEIDATHKDINVIVDNNSSFLKEHMLPIAANGHLPKDKFLLFERVKTLLSKEVVIVIGSDKHPTCVVRDIPIEQDKTKAYKYKEKTYTFTLTGTRKLAPCTQEYTYKVITDVKAKDKKKNKQKEDEQMCRNVRIYYHQWGNRFLPSEFDEILQLAMLYVPDRTVCVSDRRKEVFSLIHTLHTFCHITMDQVSIVDVLQLHTEKCNGAVLDRNELVFAMAVVMEWAYQSRSIPKELKLKHVEWCHSYAIMDKFMRKNPNIKYIHPDYLVKLDAKVRQSIYNEGFTSSPRFSERESGAVTDPYHRKNVKQHTMYSKVLKTVGTQDDGDKDDGKFWLGNDNANNEKVPLLNAVKERGGTEHSCLARILFYMSSLEKREAEGRPSREPLLSSAFAAG
ncbi:unnamed protein product [Cylicocyclus nassatus]|uniref:Receptor L-domain domain-containing protein n=1 Tax=Cylicocyclus nassatus TaxID=53992 RepID=A0AA36GPR5_CYLNA|nr:unnamed protein product [Cylicocyclus nassatus]